MKQFSKIGLQHVLRLFFILTLLTSSNLGFSTINAVFETCPGPNAYVVSKSGNSILFEWPPVTGANYYLAWCRRHEDNSVSEPMILSTNSALFPELLPGTYDFFFSATCTEGASDIIIIVDIVMQ